MPNTQITKKRLKEHMQYSQRIYILGLLAAVLVASLLFDVTRHTPSGEQLIQIALVDSYCDTQKLHDLLPELTARAQTRNPTVELLSFLSIAYSGDAADDYYGAQVYTVQIYAGDNDVYFQSEALARGMLEAGALMPLDALEGFEEFAKAHPEVGILWGEDPAYARSGDDEASDTIEIPSRPYAIDASALLGFNSRGAYDVRGKYVMLPATLEEPESVFATVADLFELLTPVAEGENDG